MRNTTGRRPLFNLLASYPHRLHSPSMIQLGHIPRLTNTNIPAIHDITIIISFPIQND